MKKLNIKQINNLMTGKSLAVEIPSSSDDLRAFISIGAYVKNRLGGTRVSKFLKMEEEGIKFSIRRYEIDNEYIQKDLDVSSDELVNSYFKKGIDTIEDLEKELSIFLNDFDTLDVEWKCDNPL